MDFAFVRALPHDDKLSVCFTFGTAEVSDRTFNFNRSKQEPLGTLISRIEQNVIKALTKNKPKKKRKEPTTQADDEDTPKVIVRLHINEIVFSHDTPNIDAWQEDAVLVVNEKNYRILINAPSVTLLSLPKLVIAGCTIYPSIEVEFCEVVDCEFTWFRRKHEKAISKDELEKPWIKIGQMIGYEVSQEDIGYALKVTCKPRSGKIYGRQIVAEMTQPIKAGPLRYPFYDRHLHTTSVTPQKHFRCVTYNILADLYADTEHTKKFLYPYCDPIALTLEYRRPLIIKEILGYNADIICLQEVDGKVFHKDLHGLFMRLGFDGIFDYKGGSVAEGCAIFFRSKKFRLVDSFCANIAETLRGHKIFKKFYHQLNKNKQLYDRIMTRTSVLLMALLESVEEPGRALLVGNTHLYFHPDADHIRLMQASVCFNFTEVAMKDLGAKYPHLSISPLICGDFNSVPECGVYQLASKGRVGPEHEDWRSNQDEYVPNLTVGHGMKLESACGLPEYTNYVGGFVGCLDYIYYDTTALTVTEVVPYPKHEDVVLHTALPSVIFPSDHIASIATLKWIE